MNLKVAHKVVLGFGVILLLLIFTSVSSISILADIEDASSKVDSLAIPTQQQSNMIQILLLKQSKLASQVSSVQSLNELTHIKTQFDAISEEKYAKRKKFSLLLEQQGLTQQIAKIDNAYQAFDIGFKEILTLKRDVITNTENVNTIQGQLNAHLDEAGALLVDLTYLEDEEHQRTIDLIAGSAGQIEGYLIGITNSSQGIVTIANNAELEESKVEIESALSNIKQLIEYLARLGEDYDTDGVITSFIEEFDKAYQLMLSQDGLFAVKSQQLTAQEQLYKEAANTEAAAEQTVTIIDQLLTLVDGNLSTLQQEVFDGVNQGQWSTLVIMVIVIIASAGIAIATIRAMILPLSRINRVLSYIAQGDLSRQLHVKSNDEYGELSKNVNSVVAHLKTLIENIGDNSHALNNASSQSSAEISEVAQSLEQQMQTVTQMTELTDALTLNADEVLSKSTSAEQEMTAALAQSEAVETKANTTASRIDNLTANLDDTAALVEVLKNEATNIGSILETIQSIADQTNLLALNAAIEAARAGEAGRGFSVVADEVRMLASRTQESTAEINTMIDSLQQQTLKVVDNIIHGKQEADGCQQQTQQLLASLTEISHAISQMHQMSSEISTSATEQNALSSDINTRILEVADISNTSSEKSRLTMEYSEQVSELADKLSSSVDEFKVK